MEHVHVDFKNNVGNVFIIKNVDGNYNNYGSF